MMNLIRARLPALALWTTINAGLWAAVWYRWRDSSSDFHVHHKSAIPPARFGQAKYLKDELPTLRGMSHHAA